MLKKEKIKELEEKIGYEFKKKELIWQALTHSSFSNEQKINKYKNYERLEFLGDAVLELLSSQFFFETYPDMPEGEMTKLRSSMVCELALAYCARDISLGDYLLLGKGEEITGGRTRDSIISDVMEAVIGALYLDGGLSEADAFVKKYILSDLESKQLFYDSKTILQEEVQRDGQSLTYELVSETGPDHDKVFMVEARIDGQTVGKGQGRNKKSAQQQAAYQALLARKK
ncbi:MAG: ribonuclease III [Lachnospiraceae bacterium]|jgi:ribonuclease-3|nr:ribonuclease III [Lachnospiraceae bacterium]MCI9095587.1 ribonuclease III [Lachnospiraceae bacterium]MCI9202148.1 ribonuclease III [Lachnospiraceae bacterium]MCI9334832.1 ribonuclease III [Lachnospiraceae bacterium]